MNALFNISNAVSDNLEEKDFKVRGQLIYEMYGYKKRKTLI